MVPLFAEHPLPEEEGEEQVWSVSVQIPLTEVSILFLYFSSNTIDVAAIYKMDVFEMLVVR